MQNRQCDRFMSEILPVTGNNPHLGYNSKKSLANSITIWHEYHRQKKHRPHNKTNFSKKNIKHAIHKDTLSSDFILHILNQALNILNQRQWRNPHWSIPVNEQVALWTEQVALPSE